MKRKITAALLAALMTISGTGAHAQIHLPNQEQSAPVVFTQSCVSGFSGNYTLTGNGATDMVAIALAQEGRTGAQMGYTEEWCADFICDCAILAGQSSAIPQYGAVAGLYDRLLSAGATEVTDNPKVGDLCFINWNGGSSMGHVEVIYAVSDEKISTIGGNSGSADSFYDRTVKKHTSLTSEYIVSILRPNYTVQEQAHTLTYELFGGTGGPSNTPFSESVTVGQEIPLLDGHYFLGWSTDAACTDIHHLPGDTLTPGTDITLYAVWAEIQCGDNMQWSMSGTRLNLTGTGSMFDYNDTLPPWYPLRNSIRTIIAEEGIASIGLNAFRGSPALTELTLGQSLTSIGESAFVDSLSLIDVYYAGTQEQWNAISIEPGNAPVLDANIHCHIHEFTTETLEPTCTEPGYTTITCTLCGYTQTDIIEPTGHTQLGGSCAGCGTTPPEAPVIRSCYSKVANSVKISWNPISNADGYELFRSTTPSDTDSWHRVKTITDGGKDYYTNKDLTVGTTYYYQLRSYKLTDAGEKIYSDFSPIAYMPAAVVMDDPYSNGIDRIRLRWLPIDGANGYQIWRQEPDGRFRIVKTIGDQGNTLTNDKGYVTAYTNMELLSGTRYTYQLRAFTITEDGRKIFGAYSDVFTVAVKPAAPSLSSVQAPATRANLQWDQVLGADGYQIWMDLGDGFRIKKTVTSGEITEATIYQLTSGNIVTFKIRAFTDVDGKKTFSAYSEAISVIIQ